MISMLRLAGRKFRQTSLSRTRLQKRCSLADFAFCPDISFVALDDPRLSGRCLCFLQPGPVPDACFLSYASYLFDRNVLRRFHLLFFLSRSPGVLLYCFNATLTFSAVIGKSLTRAPAALAMALAMAGATTVAAGSPEPTG